MRVTLAIKAGAPAKVIPERHGHSSATVTLDVYTHQVDNLHREAAEKLSRPIGR
jgi:integrase